MHQRGDPQTQPKAGLESKVKESASHHMPDIRKFWNSSLIAICFKNCSIFLLIFVNSSVMAAGPRATASVLLFGMKRMPYESILR